MDLASAARNLNNVAYSYISSWALLTACGHRVFDRLPAAAEELTDTYPDPDLVDTWMRVLEAEDLVTETDGVWSATETMSKLLVGDNSYADYLGGQVLDQMTPRLTLGHPGENELSHVLHHPEERSGYEGWFADADEARAYQESQYAGSLGPARAIARALEPEGKVLDLGGGWGAIARAVAKTHEVEVDVVDLEPVVEAAPPAHDLVTFETGNALDPDTWPTEDYDGAILSYLLSSVPGDAHGPLFSSLADTGVEWVAVHDFLIDGGELAPAWSLQHAVFVPGHISRSVEEVSTMLAEAGFTTTETVPVVDEMTTMVVASR